MHVVAPAVALAVAAYAEEATGAAAGLAAAAAAAHDVEVADARPEPPGPESEVEAVELVGNPRSDRREEDAPDGSDENAAHEDDSDAGALPAVAPGNPPLPGHGRRRRALPIVDLDALKQQRLALKRQLRECAKSVKAQARKTTVFLNLGYRIWFLFCARNRSVAAF